MKVRFKKTTWRAAGGIFAALILLVSFQNCGKAGFDAELDSNLDVGSSDAALAAKYGSVVAAKVQEIPFSFETTFDTITYNSCADTHVVNKPGFFTIKAGSYSTGGISVKPEFYDFADANFNPIHPATELSDLQYKELLVDAPVNNGAVPMMAVRAKNSLTDVYVSKGSQSVQLNKDISPLIGTLTDPKILDSFSNRGVTANYFPFSPELRILEGELSYNTSEEDAEVYRGGLTNAAVLAITYMPKSAEIYKVRAASDAYPVKTAFGKSYSFTFNQYPGITNNAPSNPSRVVGTVIERDLNTPNVGAKQWNCSRRFRIVRAADAATLCPSHTQAQLTPQVRSELEIARRHLRADQWEVNVTLGCAYPKGNVSCYKEEQVGGAPVVQYDLSQACYSPGSTVSPAPNSRCMHFISVCTRD